MGRGGLLPGRQPATGPPGSYPDRTSAVRRRRAYEHKGTPMALRHSVTSCSAGRTKGQGELDRKQSSLLP